jgi:uncharacterized membrane protein
MSSLPLSSPRSGVRAKHLLFAAIAAMFVYVLQHNERFLLDPSDPLWKHYEPMKWWLLPHGVAGLAALLLGAAQFSDRLRATRPVLHRASGRVYIASVFVAAPLGIVIQYLQEAGGAPRSFTIAAAVDGGLWMLATAMAFWCIRERRIDAHRQWMTRSYAMALVFLEVRVVLGVTGWETLGLAAVETVVWACVALAIPLADLVLALGARSRELGRPRELR